MHSLCVGRIVKAWQGIRKGITCGWRNDAYTQMYMPIVWNPLIRDVDGLMIGQKAVCWPIEEHSDPLSWDPTMYFWRTQGRIEGAKLIQIFRYNTKIGRQISLEQEHVTILQHINIGYKRALVKGD